MATIASDLESHENRDRDTIVVYAKGLLGFFSSLKLTVALFALSLVTVLVGTLAQDEMNMLEVKQRYFVSWIAPLHIDDFFPQAFLPHDDPIPGVIPFPGGALIGLMLMINLLAAKSTRFKVHAGGGKLAAGLGLIVAGTLVGAAVIFAGHSSDGLQGTPPMSYQQLWAAVMAGLVVLGISLGVAGTRISNPTFKSIAFTFAAIVGIFIAYALFTGFRIGDPGLRIVWQLAKGLGAGVILLFGCLLVFDRQGGNVLLHVGVGLLMVGQFVFGDRQLEQRLSLVEGQSSNTLINLDLVEMTFIEQGDGKEEVTAIPGSRLRSAHRSEKLIEDDALPVNVRVLAFYDNSTLKDVTPDDLATTGVGLEVRAVEISKSGGTDSEINLASAYVELLDKSSGDSLGKHLISQLIADREMLKPDGKTSNIYDSITVADTKYDVGLKFHREVKPYWVHLEDVRQVTYSGTSTPRDYSSFIRIVDTETGEDRKERVWMNNPLRYRGETFYQENYTTLPSGKEMTGIQVVRNSGWLIPYVACSITALGMLAHFFGTLTRFLKRRERETRKEQAELAEFNLSPPSKRPVVLTIAGCAMLAVSMLVPWSAVMNKLRPKARATQFDFYTAGKLPTQFGGRVMPLDAYARQALKAISNRESLDLEKAPAGIQQRVSGISDKQGSSAGSKSVTTGRSGGKKLSAMQWLMELAVDQPELRFLPMFRIDAEEVRSELGLERRESKLYSLDEISKQWSRVSKIVEAVVESEKAPRDQSFKERKLLELDRRTRNYTLAAASFQLPVPEEIPADVFETVMPGADKKTRDQFAWLELRRRMDALKSMSAPAIVPPTRELSQNEVNDPKWSAFAPAFFDLEISNALDEDNAGRPGIESFSEMIKAYGDQDTAGFNKAVDDHLAAVQQYPIRGYNSGFVSMERWMQSNWPTGVAMILYLITLIMGLVYFAVNLPRLRQAVWGALVIAVLVHTLAIICRITITGRAPVINIYSSAVFIGWAAVVFGLVVERLFNYGIGNILSSAAGVLTLLVAYGLNTGDTMPVLQAVLDTQFWLATHVISVTLGYVATLVAGTLGVGYLMTCWKNSSKSLLRTAQACLLAAAIYGLLSKSYLVAGCLAFIPAFYLLAQRIADDKQLKHSLYRSCYGAACFGILFSFVGTVLGGLWADDSWGRFWGWDPKENGALLIVIWNALMLHARWDGMVGPRGFASLAIGGNIVTAWSWFGTNELGIGLHSYGFTSGVLMWLTIFVASQLLIVAFDGLFRLVGSRAASGAA